MQAWYLSKQLKNGVEKGSRIHMKTNKRHKIESWVKMELRMKWGPKLNSPEKLGRTKQD